jgi:hypothetical protein
MTIQELIDNINEFESADLISVSFSDENLLLHISVTDNNSKRAFQITCKSVGAFRLSDIFTEWMELESDSPEVESYCSRATTYIIWSDSVDWPRVIGRITQEFAGLLEFMNPEYLQQTKKYADYCLPITVPESYESVFQSLLKELSINAYIGWRRDYVGRVQLLRFGERSYIIAKEFDVDEVAV